VGTFTANNFCTADASLNQIDCATSGSLADDDLSGDLITALSGVTTVNDGDYCQGGATSTMDCDVTTIPDADVDNNITIDHSSAGTLTLDATVAPTTEGVIAWDATNDELEIGETTTTAIFKQVGTTGDEQLCGYETTGNQIDCDFTTSGTGTVVALTAAPTFTGDALAVTPGASDNDTSIATSAFVTSSTTTFTNKSIDGDGTGNAIMIPDGAAGVASATENIAIDDSNEGQISFYDGGSTAVRYINAEKEVCKTIETLTTADDDVPIYWTNRPIKLLSASCTYTGATDPDVTLTDEAGNQIIAWTTAGTACGATPTYTDVSGDADGTLATTEGLEFDTVTAPDSGSWTVICFTFRETAQ
jgi:hypothetical protein